MQWLRRLLQRHTRQIPDLLWRTCVARLPFLQRLPEHELSRLKVQAETLLATKPVTAANGLELTDEMAVLIAAQACLLTLNLTLDLYDDMVGVIVYPSAFIVPQNEMDAAGVVHEWHEPLSGEALQAGGAVVLSWEDAASAVESAGGHNLVIHEFAHKVDMGRGAANGCPPFLARYHGGMEVRLWQQAFSAAYADFIRRVDALDGQLPSDFNPDRPADAAHFAGLSAALPLDPYAATHPAEFFAVASEAFFVLPQPLSINYPDVYELLVRYYRQNPMTRGE
jgi:Mlc titration factor MtfA (ptsG expression regulator)